MTPNMQFTRRLALAWPAALTCLTLAGCGASAGFTDRVMASLSPNSPAPSVRADHGAPTIYVTIPSLGVSGGMARISLRGNVSEWRSSDGIGLTLRGGQIIATRGLGPDLMIRGVCLHTAPDRNPRHFGRTRINRNLRGAADSLHQLLRGVGHIRRPASI